MIDISTEDISLDIQDVFFRGVQPDIDYSMLEGILGEPMEYLDLPGSYDEKEHSPIYYYPDGIIICHWSGDEDELMGMIEYVPFNTYPIYLETFILGNCSDYAIKPTTNAVRILDKDVLYFKLIVENYRITKIEYWLAKRSFLNVAY